MTDYFQSFTPNSRVWVYGAGRKLNNTECLGLQIALDEFTQHWTAHEILLKAKATVLEGHFVVLMVDEAVAQVSGCGIDKSVKLMQQLGEKFGLDFFNRLMVYFETESGVSMLPLNKVSIAIADGTLKEDTLLYNPLVQTKSDLTNKWKIQLIDSWLGNKLPKAV